MKNKAQFLTMAAAVFFLLFTSCGKDDDKDLSGGSDSEKTTAIVGRWEFVKDVWQETPGDTETEPGVNGEYIEFKKDGAAVVRRYDEDEEKLKEDSGFWKVKGGKLFLAEDREELEDPEDGMTIVKLTSSELVLEEAGTYKDQDNRDIKWKHTTYLKK